MFSLDDQPNCHPDPHGTESSDFTVPNGASKVAYGRVLGEMKAVGPKFGRLFQFLLGIAVEEQHLPGSCHPNVPT